MKKLSLFLICFLLLFSVIKLDSSYADSITYYTFFGIDDGTTGSATMLIDVTGNTLTATVENTSPVDQDSDKEPGITGFGFDLDPDNLVWTSWSLVADEYDIDTDSLVTTTIGDSDIEGDDDPVDLWTMGTFDDGVRLDYLPAIGDIKGALYNPDAVLSDGLSATPNFFTTATLTMVFNQDISLVESFSDKGQDQPSPFVRMQAVGDGSLKLIGTPTDPPLTDPDPPEGAVPEPGTMLLLGFGLISLAGIGRRKIKK